MDQNTPMSAVEQLGDLSALQDIATNGKLLSEALSQIIQALESWQTLVLKANHGGTGLDQYVIGDLLYADSVSTLARLADVAAGKVLVSGGVGVPPAWDDVPAGGLSGEVPVANGGTGRNALTAYNVLVGDGTSDVALIAPGTTNYPFISKGASANPAYEQMTTKWMYAALSLFPENGDQRIVINSQLALTITNVTTRSTTGTATLTVKINTTALGGTANSVSTSEQSQSHSSANVVAVGDDIVLTWASVSACENVSILISGTMLVPQ
jgi:hypothetical protein